MGNACERRSRPELNVLKHSGGADPESPSHEAKLKHRWSIENYVEICKEGEEDVFRGKIHLLDESQACSRPSAVDQLNHGMIICPEGFCMVHALTNGKYYLLYTQDAMRQRGLELLGLTEEDIAARERERQEMVKRQAAEAQRMQHKKKLEQLEEERRNQISRGEVKEIEFLVSLDKSEGETIGLKLRKDIDTNTIHVLTVCDEGLIVGWNEANPGSAVRKGDRIVQINDVKADSDGMWAECQKRGPITFTIKALRLPSELPRPITKPPVADVQTKELAIKVDKSGGEPVGLKLRFSSETIIVIDIVEGLARAWNDANPDGSVQVGDRIVEVNGERGDPKHLASILQQKAELTIVFSRKA